MAIAKILIVDDLVENLLLLEFALKPFEIEIVKTFFVGQKKISCVKFQVKHFVGRLFCPFR